MIAMIAMTELTFTRPELWPFLFLAPPLWFCLLAICRQRRRALRRYGAPLVERSSTPAARASRLVLSLILLHVTYMEPRYGEEKVSVQRRGLDLIFCLDTSRSMLARDMDPNRLGRAKRDITSVLPELVGGDRVGLVAFAGEARLVVPLTHDVDSFRQLLALVDTDAVRKGGTDLAAAIRKALGLLGEGDDAASTTVIILLTDGEDLTGAGQQAAREAGLAGVILHTVGYGSTKGSKIILEKGGEQSFLENEKGGEVVTALDTESLRSMAQAAGGEFLRADVMPLPLRQLKAKRLDPMLKRAYEEDEETIYRTRFQWTLLPAMLLLLLEMFWFGGSRR